MNRRLSRHLLVSLTILLPTTTLSQDCETPCTHKCIPQYVENEAVISIDSATIDCDPIPPDNYAMHTLPLPDAYRFSREIAPGYFLVTALDGFITDEDLEKLRGFILERLGYRARVERNQYYSATAGFDPGLKEQWGLRNCAIQCNSVTGDGASDINAPEAWALLVNKQRQSVKVAVLDSGIPTNALAKLPNDLTSVVRASFDAITPKKPDVDKTGHGTAVIGILGAARGNKGKIEGVADLVELTSVRVLDDKDRGTLASLIAGIHLAVCRGNRVVNLSLTACKEDAVLRGLISASAKREVLFVAAAGNRGCSLKTAPEYPAAFALDSNVTNVLSVSGFRADGKRVGDSNFCADVAGPGSCILSLALGNKTDSFSGTSFATPFASGTAALVLSLCDKTASALRRCIIDSARKCNYDCQIDAWAAVQHCCEISDASKQAECPK